MTQDELDLLHVKGYTVKSATPQEYSLALAGQSDEFDISETRSNRTHEAMVFCTSERKPFIAWTYNRETQKYNTFVYTKSEPTVEAMIAVGQKIIASPFGAGEVTSPVDNNGVLWVNGGGTMLAQFEDGSWWNPLGLDTEKALEQWKQADKAMNGITH